MSVPAPERVVEAVCEECARGHGGLPPPDDAAAVDVYDECDACKRTAPVWDVQDWTWPAGVPRGWRGAERERG